MENKIKIFIAENTIEQINEMKNYLSHKMNFEIVGTSTNGNDILNEIKEKEVDVLVMDLVLMGVDGFEVIDSLKKIISKMPKIIITSSLTNPNFVDKAMSMGVNYFMLNPINFQTLEKRIIDVMEEKKENEFHKVKTEKNKILEEKISNVFITIGIPAHIKGYQFLREAIKISIEEPEIINSITKKLYPTIAKHFNTSSSKVERAIRHAIEVAWNRGKIENINNIFGIKVYNQNEKPTNGEFIALVADKMLMEGFGD